MVRVGKSKNYLGGNKVIGKGREEITRKSGKKFKKTSSRFSIIYFSWIRNLILFIRGFIRIGPVNHGISRIFSRVSDGIGGITHSIGGITGGWIRGICYGIWINHNSRIFVYRIVAGISGGCSRAG